MLQNEPQTETLTVPGQVRITPEELSRAVAGIERRKENEAQRLAGTIPIAEAVSNLHLDVTPEEIWAEVQAQRMAETAARQAAAAQAETTPGQSRQAQVQPAPLSRGRRSPWRGILTIGAALWFLHIIGVGPQLGHTSRPTPPALTATVAQMADGKEFYSDAAGLVQISEGKAPQKIHVAADQPFSNSWTLVKMAGHVYLRAYTAPLTSLQAIKGQPLVLYNDDNSGSLEGIRTAQTTLRVDNVPLQISGGGENYTQITVPHFQPDAFTTTSPWR